MKNGRKDIHEQVHHLLAFIVKQVLECLEAHINYFPSFPKGMRIMIQIKIDEISQR